MMTLSSITQQGNRDNLQTQPILSLNVKLGIRLCYVRLALRVSA